jgi:hypothetical protein
LKAVPDARYLLLNLSTGLTLSAEEEDLLKNCHVLFDTSGRNITSFHDFYSRVGKDRVALGTHFPILDYCTGLLRIESLRATEADEAEKDLFRYRNAHSFLRL